MNCLKPPANVNNIVVCQKFIKQQSKLKLQKKQLKKNITQLGSSLVVEENV